MKSAIKQIIENYYRAWKGEDPQNFPLAPSFTFDGPLQSMTSPEEFRGMAAQFLPMVMEVKILDAAYEDEKAFVLCETVTNIPQMQGWLSMDYSIIESGNIKYGRTIYDPRPILEFLQSRT